MTTRLIREGGAVRINKLCVLLFLVYLLTTSCTTVRLADVEKPPGDKPVVFGRIKVIEEGQPVDWDRRLPRFGVHIISDAGPQPIPYSYRLTEDGSFFWSFPPGGYLITEFSQLVGFWKMRVERRGILARFVVPEAPGPIYIGTLTIREESEGRYAIRIEDEYDQALQRLKQRFPEVSGPAAKRLMELR